MSVCSQSPAANYNAREYYCVVHVLTAVAVWFCVVVLLILSYDAMHSTSLLSRGVSRSSNVSERLRVSLKLFHHMIGTSVLSKTRPQFRWDDPLTWALNIGWV